jgi:hypothetical protein
MAWTMLAGCAAAEAPPRSERSALAEGVAFDELLVEGGGLRAFWIGRCEVTWGEFNLFDEARGAADGVTRPTRAKSYLRRELPREALGPRFPVTHLRWHAAMAYCRWLSVRTGRYYRLPTLAEWSRACGPGDAWHAGNSGGRPHEVGGKAPNGLGLHDGLGNAAEYALEVGDDGPVLLGGAWDTPPGDLSPSRRDPVGDYGADSSLPQSVWWVSGGSTQGFRVARPEGAATPAELEAYAPRLDVRVLGHEPRTTGAGAFVQFWTRVSLEIRNGGDRMVDEVELLIHAMTPGGRPHWVDSGSTDKPGRATFTWAYPALRNGAAGPLRPGESRRFHADLPESFDDGKSVDKASFGFRITGLCLGGGP